MYLYNVCIEIDSSRGNQHTMPSIDSIYHTFLSPLFRYPIVMVLPFVVSRDYVSETYRRTILLTLAGLTILINSFIIINTHYKRNHNTREWETLQGKPFVMVITGASSGLGASIIKQVYKKYQKQTSPNNTQLFKIINIDKTTSLDSELQSLINNYPRVVEYVEFDLNSSPDKISQLCTFITSEHGNVDILINNAGMRYRFKPMDQHSPEEIADIFQVNVFSGIQLIAQLKPKYVVNVASVLGMVSPVNVSSYAATKAAMIAFHDSWINESHSHGLLVLPGQLGDTQMFQTVEAPRQFLAPLVDSTDLSIKIVEKIDKCESGELSAPLYGNFIPLLKVVPFSVNKLMRYLSGMDKCIEM